MDHQTIGTQQELFFFDDKSPGSCFFLPHGTRIYNKLKQFIQNEYWKRGYEEVMTPNICKNELWKLSGHWDKYRDDMFAVNGYDKIAKGKEPNYSLCPMSCPKHCLMFGIRNRSYKELPLKYADFAALHRNELKGALHGLVRTKRFAQDDAHIFCTHEQIEDQIKECLEFLEHVYSIFGFQFTLELSTRPEKYIGSIDVWNKAEQQLENALNAHGKEWKLDPQQGAFYGPKIDIHVKDALNRSHQCATIQLDFNLPSEERFNLKYVDENQELKTPVIIHRAIYGSFERFIAILCEHYQGKWPFWLSPRQVVVIPISEKHLDYAKEVQNAIRQHKYYVDVDDTDNTVPKKVRNAQVHQYNYILAVGNREVKNKTVFVRYRDSSNKKEVSVDDLLKELENS